MSEDKRKYLAETLSSLSNEDKAWVINFLVQGLFAVPTKDAVETTSGRRTATVIRRHGAPSDAQLQALFGDKESPSIPEEDYSWSDVINANSGKTIQPIEKWL